jgi:hypothetical protein
MRCRLPKQERKETSAGTVELTTYKSYYHDGIKFDFRNPIGKVVKELHFESSKQVCDFDLELSLYQVSFLGFSRGCKSGVLCRICSNGYEFHFLSIFHGFFSLSSSGFGRLSN